MANSMVRDLRKKTNAELAELIAKCKEQLLQIRFNVANGEVEKLHTIPEIRKTIARSLTILNERSMEANNDKATSSKKGTVNND
ncbi:MAG: 50S ribosomal protein L29 [Mycoplasma sp.]